MAKPEQPLGGTELPPQRRWPVVVGVLVAITFVAVVVLSSRDALVSVGGEGTGVSSGTVTLRTRDAADRPLTLPGGRAGVLLFSQASGCAECPRFARAAAAAAARARPPLRVVVVMVDVATTREEVAAFARRVARRGLRYVIDDRLGSLAAALDADDFATALVFDRRGRVVARPRTQLAPLTRAARRAAAR